MIESPSSPVKERARPHGKSYEDGGEVDDLPQSSVSKLVSQDSVADHHVSGSKCVILLYDVRTKWQQANHSDNQGVKG